MLSLDTLKCVFIFFMLVLIALICLAIYLVGKRSPEAKENLISDDDLFEK